MIVKAAIALVVAAVILLALYFARGVMLTPVHTEKHIRLTVIVEADGAAPGLEYTVDGLLWLRQSGVLPATVIIYDGGMDSETRAAAEKLSRDMSVGLAGGAGEITVTT